MYRVHHVVVVVVVVLTWTNYNILEHVCVDREGENIIFIPYSCTKIDIGLNLHVEVVGSASPLEKKIRFLPLPLPPTCISKSHIRILKHTKQSGKFLA